MTDSHASIYLAQEKLREELAHDAITLIVAHNKENDTWNK